MKMKVELFRGDGDYLGTRNLKGLLSRGQTNLVGGGNGREIFEKPIIENIQNHITDNWKNTHFLSFSENLDTAVNFGRGSGNLAKEFNEYWEEEDSWDFVVLSIDSHNLVDLKEQSPGVYSTHFVPTFKQFLPIYNIVLIDVVKVLSTFPVKDVRHKRALENAKRDSEWLLLPAASANFGTGTEFRGLLDSGIFSEIQKYRFVE